MKKNYILSIITVCISIQLNAQVFKLSTKTATYSALNSSANSLNNALPWDDPEFEIPIGFSFKIDSISYDTLQIIQTSLLFGDSIGGLMPYFIPFLSDLIDRSYDIDSLDGGKISSSPISYETTGLSGNKILKIEFENAGFYEDLDDNNVSVDSINFQIWLFETSNKIELHFGSSSVSQPSLAYENGTGPGIIWIPSYDFTLDSLLSDVYFVEGSPSSPLLRKEVDVDSIYTLNATIPNGTVYEFTPQIQVGLKKFSSERTEFTIYPNPAQNSITIKTEELIQNQLVQLVNLTGKVVRSENISGFSNTINVDNLSNGIYFLSIGNMNQKVIISR